MATAAVTTHIRVPTPTRPRIEAATSEMNEVATKVVEALIASNFIGCLEKDKDKFKQTSVQRFLDLFILFFNTGVRAHKLETRTNAFTLALLHQPKETIDQYAKFSGYSIVWQGQYFSDLQELQH